MGKDSRFLFFLIALGGFSLLLSFATSFNTSAPPPTAESLAHVEVLSGNVVLEKKSGSLSETLHGTTSLSDLDSLEIEEGAEAMLRFKDGYQLRAHGPLSLLLERRAPSVILVASNNSLSLELPGARGSLFIQVGEGTTPQEAYYYFSQLRQNATHDKMAELPPRPESKTLDTFEGSLTDRYLKEVLRSQQRLFHRCYTQLLQRDPQATGQATLNLKIEKTGKVSSASIPQGTLRDSDFQKCLLAVAKRITFKAFSGNSVEASIPLLFN